MHREQRQQGSFLMQRITYAVLAGALLLGASSTAQARWFLGVRVVQENPDSYGLKITQVIPGTPAARLGLKPGDVLGQMNDTILWKVSDLDQALANSRGNASMNITRSDGPGWFTTRLTWVGSSAGFKRPNRHPHRFAR
jgi:membrane-associated protease RseP (regulator of RpoE activity)